MASDGLRPRRAIAVVSVALGQDTAVMFGLDAVDASLQGGGEVTSVAYLEFVEGPVVAGDAAAAVRFATGTFKLVVGHAVTHGIVKTDLFAGLDVTHGDNGDLAVESGVGVAGMINVVTPFWFWG